MGRNAEPYGRYTKELKINYKKEKEKQPLRTQDGSYDHTSRQGMAVSTIQVDFNLPARFELSYVDENGQDQRPVMLHRATFGSYEDSLQ